MKESSTIKNPGRLLLFFIIAWLAINFIQAAFTMLDGDEAYYWIYSRVLAWGYFDHPPMVALSVRLGESFGHGNIFTRLGTVMFSAATIYFGFKAIPEYLREVRFYILAFASVVLFHVYSFIVTPDSSLLFFVVLFFYAYRLFLINSNLIHTVFLALGILGLLYSKYHGILPVFFVFLSNPRLVLKPASWMVVVLVLLGFLPHLVWQWNHDWPTFRYHLSERIGSGYRIDKTTSYLLGQLFIWGPLTTIPALFHFFKKRKTDLYLRAHYFNFFGILGFFFLNSFRSTIEPHWTLAAGISFLVLFHLAWKDASARFRGIMTRLLVANVILLIIARVLFVVPDSPLKKVLAFKTQMFGKGLADSVHKYADGLPVVFQDSYTYPSLYSYYFPGVKTTGYSTIYSRKNQFDLSGDEALLNNKKVYIASHSRKTTEDIEVNNPHTVIYLHLMDSFVSTNGLKITWKDAMDTGEAGLSQPTLIDLTNSGSQYLQTKNLSISYAFIKSRKEINAGALTEIPGGILAPGAGVKVPLVLQFPVTPGEYKLVFSIVQPSLAGTMASNFHTIHVK